MKLRASWPDFAPRKSKCGFTLVELLTVLGIIAILVGLAVPTISGISSSGNFTKSSYDIKTALEQARAYAMANNTYVWVGFYEEDGSPTAKPGTAGVGRVVVSIVASKDGTRYDPTNTSPPPIDGLVIQVARLMKIPNVHLVSANTDNASTNVPARPAVTNAYEVGDPAFGDQAGTTTPNPTTFNYPIGSTSPQYTFQNIIEFSPDGSADKICGSPTPWMEIAIQPTRGDFFKPGGPQLIALQLAGTTGSIKIYRL